MSSICIIPSRGGSKRIHRKNVKSFCGSPIIKYSIDAALQSGLFDEVMVSTDDKEIADIALNYGAEVPFFRSAENSNDHAGTAEVLIEVLEEYKKRGKTFNRVCCLYPTAPLVKSSSLNSAAQKLDTDKYDSVFTVTEFSYPILRSLKEKDGYFFMNWPENYEKRSQDLPASYHDAGQFYFLKVSALLEEKMLFTARTGCIVLSNLEVQDIDNETDWQLAELKFKLMKKEN